MDKQFQLRLPVAALVYWLGGNGGQRTVKVITYGQVRATHFQVRDTGDEIQFGLHSVEDAPVIESEDLLGDFYARILPVTIFADTALVTMPKRALNGIAASRTGVLYWKKLDGSVTLSLINEGSGIEELLRGRLQSDILFFSSSAVCEERKLDA